MNRVVFSSVNPVYATPDWLFESLQKEFGFTLDVCANPDNAKCLNFITSENDGLLQNWEGVVWCNPPYGRSIGLWVHKAYMESFNGITSVLLLPARTDTRWFHTWVLGKAEIRFIKGRLKFGSEKNLVLFPSMIIIFRFKTNQL